VERGNTARPEYPVRSGDGAVAVRCVPEESPVIGECHTNPNFPPSSSEGESIFDAKAALTRDYSPSHSIYDFGICDSDEMAVFSKDTSYLYRFVIYVFNIKNFIPSIVEHGQIVSACSFEAVENAYIISVIEDVDDFAACVIQQSQFPYGKSGDLTDEKMKYFPLDD
jgi:hypothetical protein